ncbi:MAG: three-Cys-motif partner protein TcmP, partial [Lentisphaerota bacterium]
MNLIDLFDKASESPEFIPKLRQLILDLAVCGKLVSQNPKDEPAAELLKRIENEKSILLKNGIIKKSEAVRPSCGKNINLELPNGWSPTNLQMLCISISDGDHQPPPKAEEGVPFLVIGNVRTQTLDFAGCRHVTQEYYNSLDSIRRPQKHDILYTLVGSWSLKKYELVKNYARIFSTSMKNKWDCRVYIDLYAGAGYSKIRDNLKIVQASPLLAVDIPDRFDKYIFCEIDKEKIEALKVRVERDFKNIDANYINLDANASVDNVLNLIPAYSKNFKVLCFCFVDVYKASDFNFKTIKRLSQRYMDFLI